VVIVVSDTSVLIDMENAELTKKVFQLPWKFVVPDIVFEEELSTHHGHLLQEGLEQKSMSEASIMQAVILRKHNPKISTNDILALKLAIDQGSVLLTGDKALKKLAETLHVEVHGSIWLVQEMLKQKIIILAEAQNAFKLMKETGSHLPWSEVDRAFGFS
jgi:predicted nucleic acid-binding protein